MKSTYRCPKCKVSLKGKTIPKALQKDFGSKFFSRVISVYSLELDRTIGFRCPDCNYMWDRER